MITALDGLRVVVVVMLMLSACADWPRSAMNITALKVAANKAYAAEQWTAAGRRYREYLETVPADPHAWYRLGNVEARQGRLRQAEAAYYAAPHADPDLARAEFNLGLVQARLSVRSLQGARAAMAQDAMRNRAAAHLLSCLASRFTGGSTTPGCPSSSPNEVNHD